MSGGITATTKSNNYEITGSSLGDKRGLDVSVLPTEYKTIVDEASDTVTYVGKAVAGSSTSQAVWNISKFTVSGNTITTKTSADGDFNYDNIWDNRASLNYS